MIKKRELISSGPVLFIFLIVSELSKVVSCSTMHGPMQLAQLSILLYKYTKNELGAGTYYAYSDVVFTI